MNQGPIWGRLLKKTRGRKSRATVPLRRLQGESTISQLNPAWVHYKVTVIYKEFATGKMEI